MSWSVTVIKDLYCHACCSRYWKVVRSIFICLRWSWGGLKFVAYSTWSEEFVLTLKNARSRLKLCPGHVIYTSRETQGSSSRAPTAANVTHAKLCRRWTMRRTFISVFRSFIRSTRTHTQYDEISGHTASISIWELFYCSTLARTNDVIALQRKYSHSVLK